MITRPDVFAGRNEWARRSSIAAFFRSFVIRPFAAIVARYRFERAVSYSLFRSIHWLSVDTSIVFDRMFRSALA
jgi:hypothetical protein